VRENKQFIGLTWLQKKPVRDRSITLTLDCKAMPCLRRLVFNLSPWMSEFAPGSVHVGFVMNRLALGQAFSEFFRSSLSVSFHLCSILIHHLAGWTIDTLVAAVQRHSFTAGLCLVKVKNKEWCSNLAMFPGKGVVLSRSRLCHYGVGGAWWHLCFYESF
jgi:hypothetical protein